MADSIDKIVSRIPQAEGGFRRRFASGIVLVVPILLTLSLLHAKAQETLRETLTSPGLAFALAVLIYTIGNLVEMLGELYFARYAARLIRSFRLMREWDRQHRLLAVLMWSFWPIQLVRLWRVLRSVRSDKSSGLLDDLMDDLGEQGRLLFDGFPKNVQQGFKQPDGQYAELSWRYLKSACTGDLQGWIIKLNSRNRDILAVTSALVVLWILSFLTAYLLLLDVVPADSFDGAATVVPADFFDGPATVVQPDSFDDPATVVPADSFDDPATVVPAFQNVFLVLAFFAIGVAPLPVALLFAGYFRLLSNTTVNAIEMLAEEPRLLSARTEISGSGDDNQRQDDDNPSP